MTEITDARKKILVELYGKDGCLQADSWIKALGEDLKGNKTIYSTDMDFLYNHRTYCTPPSGPEGEDTTGGGGTGGTGGTPEGEDTGGTTGVGTPNMVRTATEITIGGKKFSEAQIITGADNWFGVEYKNTGTASWRGYIGIKLINTNNEPIFQWTQDPKYSQTIAAGETKTIMAKVPIPGDIVVDTVKVAILRYAA